jgi:hypothetical protein
MKDGIAMKKYMNSFGMGARLGIDLPVKTRD